MRINPGDVVYTAIVLAGAGGAMTVANGLTTAPGMRQAAQVTVAVVAMLAIATRMSLL